MSQEAGSNGRDWCYPGEEFLNAPFLRNLLLGMNSGQDSTEFPRNLAALAATFVATSTPRSMIHVKTR